MTQEQGSRSKIANYQKILASNPRSFIFAQLAEEHMKFGEADQAIEICRAGLAHNPDFADGKFVLAKSLFRAGAKDEAVRELFEILLLQPEHYNAKETLLRMGHSETSILTTLRTMKAQVAPPPAQAPVAPRPAPPAQAPPKMPSAPAIPDEEADSLSVEIDLDGEEPQAEPDAFLFPAPGIPTPEPASPQTGAAVVGMPQPVEERDIAPASKGNRSIPTGSGTAVLPPTSPRQTLAVMGAQKTDVDAATLQEHMREDEKKSRTGLWALVALLAVALGVGGFFGGRFVLQQMAQKETLEAYDKALETARQDTYEGYQTVLRTLPRPSTSTEKAGSSRLFWWKATPRC